MWRRNWLTPRVQLVIPFFSLLLLVSGCSSAAPPTPMPTSTTQATATPSVTPMTQASATPTAGPTATFSPVPEAPTVNTGKLTIMIGDLGNERFDNVFATGTVGSANYGRLVGAMLISDSERREMLPGVATSWGVSADALTWSFTIRKGVKFHDGTDLTPEDVLWSMQHQYGPEAIEYLGPGAGARRLSEAMEKIELSSPDTVSLTTKSFFPGIDFMVSETGNGWTHVMPRRNKLHDEAVEAAYDNNPIGAGPMSFVSRVPAYSMTFERFDDYYYQPNNGLPEDKRMNFQTLDLFLVPEESTRVAAVRAGEADIVPASLASRNQVESGGGRVIFGQEGVTQFAILLGCFDPQTRCHNKQVRQALNYAINKELIQDRLFGGPEVFQTKGWVVVTPSTIGYSPEIDPFPYDPDKARQLLADAGYPGGQGFGKLIVHTYRSPAVPVQSEAAQLAADFWKRELGLDVEVEVSDSTAIRARERAGELKDHILWREQETRIDATTSVANRYSDPESISVVHDQPELFTMAQETFQIIDTAQKAEASKALFRRLVEESYEIGIGYVNIPWAVGPGVEAWQPYPLALYPSALHTVRLK